MSHAWSDVLENYFMVSACKEILSEEKSVILSLDTSQNYGTYLDLLITSCYFDNLEIVKSANFFNQENSESITKKIDFMVQFKQYFFQSKELISNKLKWVELVQLIRVKKIQKELNLSELTDILYFTRFFEDIQPILVILKEEISSNTNFHKKIALATLKKIFESIVNIQENFDDLFERIEMSLLQDSATWFLKLLIKKLTDDFTSGLRYQQTEIALLKKTINTALSLRVYENMDKKLSTSLNEIRILKWENLLKIKKIRIELCLGDKVEDDELIHDLLVIEKNRGHEITKRFISTIRSSGIEELQLRFLVKKIKKNIWELNNDLIDNILTKRKPSDWIQLIREHETKEKGKNLDVNQLVSLMKRLEAPGEINNSIKYILDKTEGESLLEKTVSKIEEAFKKPIYLPDTKINKKIADFTDSDVKEWSKHYKRNMINKKEVNCISDDSIVELVALVSQGCEIVNGYRLRNTQMIAVLIFIDSILNNKTGRLANISTGEGKSIITIATAIAQLLIRGGTIDILTSSEVLAERDAVESQAMFALFKINVTNNCDAAADANEATRKERYEQNTVVYGEIGHFQRDLLLTKYYNKGIRKQLATCLIIDEVDSMCIDNMCNTLYISHQIASLRELKDIYIRIWQATNLSGSSEYTTRNVDQVKKYIERLIDERQIKIPFNLKEFVERRLKTWITNAYLAKLHIEEGNHYSVLESGKRIGESVINDLQTGVEQMNTQWSEGLQQFIQLKHTQKLNEESLKAIFMSNFNFFKQYSNGGCIYGMTGTLGASLERELLSNAYGLDFFQLPRFKKELNVREEPILVAERSTWLQKIKEECNAMVESNEEPDQELNNLCKSNKPKVVEKLKYLKDKLDNLVIERDKQQNSNYNNR